jgi:hypothetical protein
MAEAGYPEIEGDGWVGKNKPLYIDHPQFEGFEVRQTVRRGETAVA